MAADADQHDDQQLAERVVAAMMANDAFSRWLGIAVISARPHAVVVRATVRPEMVNGFGVVHGGIAYSVADTALALASNTHGKVTVAIENAITYPAAIRVGDTLTAAAESESQTNRLGFYRVTVQNQNDETVALFRGTVYKTRDDHHA